MKSYFKSLAKDRFLIPFLLFGVILNLFWFYIFGELENTIFKRSLIFSYLSYSILPALLHQYMFGISILSFIRISISYFVFLMLIIASFLILLNTGSFVIVYAVLLLIFMLFITYFLVRFFKITLSLAYLIELVVLSLISLAVIHMPDYSWSHDFGLHLILSMVMFTFTYLAVKNHKPVLKEVAKS
ncbi:hypothetical protein [Flavobacterium alkalisoli]|uniref:hypothetical protein n=1 Tax=Flavobacterium alkalisoli TaxID=2602769 RepID=UPI003A922D51